MPAPEPSECVNAHYSGTTPLFSPPIYDNLSDPKSHSTPCPHHRARARQAELENRCAARVGSRRKVGHLLPGLPSSFSAQPVTCVRRVGLYLLLPGQPWGCAGGPHPQLPFSWHQCIRQYLSAGGRPAQCFGSGGHDRIAHSAFRCPSTRVRYSRNDPLTSQGPGRNPP